MESGDNLGDESMADTEGIEDVGYEYQVTEQQVINEDDVGESGDGGEYTFEHVDGHVLDDIGANGGVTVNDIIAAAPFEPSHEQEQEEIDMSQVVVMNKESKFYTRVRPDRSELRYECDKCELAFRYPHQLKQHKNGKHEGNYPFSCNKCGKSFDRASSYRDHIKYVHTDRRDFQCSQCDKAFKMVGALRKHIREIHRESATKFQCEYCNKLFATKASLQSHFAVHTEDKPFVCKLCGRGFKQKNNLKIHKLTHTKEKIFQCKDCDKMFNREYALKIHARNHMPVKPYKCEFCPLSFSQLHALKTHTRLHTGERPFKCQYCDRAFAQLSTLQSHTQRHTGEKKFHCSVCPRSFFARHPLKEHMRSHTGEKPYQCVYCPYRATINHGVVLHMKNRHKNEPQVRPVFNKNYTISDKNASQSTVTINKTTGTVNVEVKTEVNDSDVTVGLVNETDDRSNLRTELDDSSNSAMDSGRNRDDFFQGKSESSMKNSLGEKGVRSQKSKKRRRSNSETDVDFSTKAKIDENVDEKLQVEDCSSANVERYSKRVRKTRVMESYAEADENVDDDNGDDDDENDDDLIVGGSDEDTGDDNGFTLLEIDTDTVNELYIERVGSDSSSNANENTNNELGDNDIVRKDSMGMVRKIRIMSDPEESSNDGIVVGGGGGGGFDITSGGARNRGYRDNRVDGVGNESNKSAINTAAINSNFGDSAELGNTGMGSVSVSEIESIVSRSLEAQLRDVLTGLREETIQRKLLNISRDVAVKLYNRLNACTDDKTDRIVAANAKSVINTSGETLETEHVGVGRRTHQAKHKETGELAEKVGHTSPIRKSVSEVKTTKASPPKVNIPTIATPKSTITKLLENNTVKIATSSALKVDTPATALSRPTITKLLENNTVKTTKASPRKVNIQARDIPPKPTITQLLETNTGYNPGLKIKTEPVVVEFDSYGRVSNIDSFNTSASPVVTDTCSISVANNVFQSISSDKTAIPVSSITTQAMSSSNDKNSSEILNILKEKPRIIKTEPTASSSYDSNVAQVNTNQNEDIGAWKGLRSEIVRQAVRQNLRHMLESKDQSLATIFPGPRQEVQTTRSHSFSTLQSKHTELVSRLMTVSPSKPSFTSTLPVGPSYVATPPGTKTLREMLNTDFGPGSDSSHRRMSMGARINNVGGATTRNGVPSATAGPSDSLLRSKLLQDILLSRIATQPEPILLTLSKSPSHSIKASNTNTNNCRNIVKQEAGLPQCKQEGCDEEQFDVYVIEDDSEEESPELSRVNPEIKQENPNMKQTSAELSQESAEIEPNLPRGNEGNPIIKQENPNIKQTSAELPQEIAEIEPNLPRGNKGNPVIKQEIPENGCALRLEESEINPTYPVNSRDNRNNPENLQVKYENQEDVGEYHEDIAQTKLSLVSPEGDTVDSEISVKAEPNDEL